MTALAAQVSPFDPHSASPQQRLAVGQLLADAHADSFPEDPARIPEREAQNLTHVLPDERSQQWVVWQGEQALAWAHLDYDEKQNLHLAQARIVVHPAHRHQGLAHALAPALEAAARHAGRLTVTFWTNSRIPDAVAYAGKLGATPALPMRQSRLDLQAVPRDLLAQWLQRPEGEPYRLHVWRTVPDAYLARAADMMMVMNTAPKGDLDQQDWVITPEMIRAWDKMIEESGEQRLTLAVEDTGTGQLIGYSETFWSPERAAIVGQGATAVRNEARGLGLGKWLKAAMLERILTDFPGARWVRTNNANVNEAMLGINVALGFRPWAEVTEWQLKLAE